jgi:hypothetical protein
MLQLVAQFQGELPCQQIRLYLLLHPGSAMRISEVSALTWQVLEFEQAEARRSASPRRLVTECVLCVSCWLGSRGASDLVMRARTALPVPAVPWNQQLAAKVWKAAVVSAGVGDIGRFSTHSARAGCWNR